MHSCLGASLDNFLYHYIILTCYYIDLSLIFTSYKTDHTNLTSSLGIDWYNDDYNDDYRINLKDLTEQCIN